MRFAKSDLGLTVSESFGADGRGRGIEAILDYARDIFDETTVAAMAERFTAVLRAVADDPDVTLGDIDILTEAEREQMDRRDDSGSRGSVVSTDGRSLDELLATAARINPDGIALSHGGVDLTYGALQAKSTELQTTLAAVGIGPEAAVTVALSTLLPGLLDDAGGAFAERFSAMLAAVIAESGEAPPADAVTLYDLFVEQVHRTPQAPALVFDGASLDHTEFATRVHRLARHLVEVGVGPDVHVALAMRRSFDLLVGMYAVVAAGGAYVPIDLDHPADRIAYILDSARPATVLTTSRDAFAPGSDLSVLTIDTLDLAGRPGSALSDADRRAPLRPDHCAYVIYTSGSTGRPKGVAITHRAIVNRLRWMQAEYPIGSDDAVMQKTPATFDVSVWEFFWPLQTGARLVIAAPDGHRDPRTSPG